MLKPLVSVSMLIACFLSLPADAQAEAPHKPSVSLDDLYSELNVVDTDISPSGKMIAAVVRRKDDDALISLDITTGEKKLITRINKDSFGDQLDVRMGYVVRKTNDRLLFQIRSNRARPRKWVSSRANHASKGSRTLNSENIPWQR